MRDEVLFNDIRVTKENIEFLILTRADKWGKTTNFMVFGNDPLWRTNPQGAIALYAHM